MEKREMNKIQKEEDMTSLLLWHLEELRREFRVAIESAANASYKLMSATELCKAMNISASIYIVTRVYFASRYERWGTRNFISRQK